MIEKELMGLWLNTLASGIRFRAAAEHRPLEVPWQRLWDRWLQI